jgi:hypothetical protein
MKTFLGETELEPRLNKKKGSLYDKREAKVMFYNSKKRFQGKVFSTYQENKTKKAFYEKKTLVILPQLHMQLLIHQLSLSLLQVRLLQLLSQHRHHKPKEMFCKIVKRRKKFPRKRLKSK